MVGALGSWDPVNKFALEAVQIESLSRDNVSWRQSEGLVPSGTPDAKTKLPFSRQTETLMYLIFLHLYIHFLVLYCLSSHRGAAASDGHHHICSVITFIL